METWGQKLFMQDTKWQNKYFNVGPALFSDFRPYLEEGPYAKISDLDYFSFMLQFLSFVCLITTQQTWGQIAF